MFCKDIDISIRLVDKKIKYLYQVVAVEGVHQCCHALDIE
jgi:hypothetical protein